MIKASLVGEHFSCSLVLMKSRGRSSRCGGLSVVSLYISCMGWVGE